MGIERGVLGLTTACVLLGSGLVHSHEKGTHERVLVTLVGKTLDVLVTLDADSGPPAQLIRMGTDVNRNGKLDPDEREALKRTLARRLRGALRVAISGYPVVLEEQGTKMDLRLSQRPDAEGLSVAVLLRARLPEVPADGMELTLEHRGTGASHVVADVFVGDPAADAGATVREETLAPGVPLRVRLEGLR
jgi:hypothetical protein